jgi:tetratricopeptide (TPR) repeat protein
MVLKKVLGDPKPKFRDAAAEYAALVEFQPKTDGKLEVLRRAAKYARQADEPNAAATHLERAVALSDVPEPVMVAIWVELADALLAARRLDEVWKIYREIMASTHPLSTATRYRLAWQFANTRHPEFVRLSRALFEQIAKQKTITSAEREFHERSLTELANALIREGNFAEAETWLGTQIGRYPNGPEVGLARLLLGVCLLQRAAAPGTAADDAKKMRGEALALFKKNVADCDRAEARAGKLTEHEAWLRLQSGLRVLQAHQQLRTLDDARSLLTEAGKLLGRYRGTVEELIILSLMYHAFRQLTDNTGALEVREKMEDLFRKLPPSAFTQPTGEYSRDYWQNVWFSEKK